MKENSFQYLKESLNLTDAAQYNPNKAGLVGLS